MKNVALFPGSFDPFTKGHMDIVLRGTALFDEVIVGVGINTAKQRYFQTSYMIPKIEEAFKEYPQVKIMSYEGLTAVFAKKVNARFLIRGLRNTTDFEYENTISQVNKIQWENLETVFLITDPSLAYISSSIVRDLHKYGADVQKFLPYSI
ncbi:MAG TPA: pantetheine-phosphate adenylyltransferase [Cytophagaceae bacterium]|jgi:pantetheine-phosphate adenylyltransferase|nr:pantetheine-phosphate adenylyltransferase [Cytophagaceae bacterium]